MKSLSEFVEKYRHELCGHVAEAFTTQARGGELSIRMRESFKAIDRVLAQIYAEFSGNKESR